MNAKKQHLKLMDTLICRTPVFGVTDEQDTCWPQLKELIKEASPEFYNVIAGWDAEHLNAVNEKTAFTIWKYFNRSRFRSTPFGNFAAISFVPVPTGDSNAQPLSIKSKMISQQFTDWSAKDDYLQNAKKTVQRSEWFQSNSTYYIVGDQLRYIKHTDGQFELVTVMVFDELDKLLATCRISQSKRSVYGLMFLAFEMHPHAVDNLLCQLVECQLLLTDRMPNIIGEDYFKRVNLPQKNDTQRYIIAERELNDGQPDIQPLNMLAEYLELIKDFIPGTKNKHLTTFKQEFSRKFDLKAVPLSVALDPETGIGYGDMAQAPQEPALSAVFAGLQKKEATATAFTYTTQHRFLLNALMKGNVIRLETFKNDNTGNSDLLPNTLSVMYHYWQGMPVIQTAGGCTASSLIGRFTLACGEAERVARQIVTTEESANPQVLFFDIAYQAEKRVDNVNRRKQIYNYELPILTWSCSGSTLSMDDIWVMVRSGEVILWSKQYNKRLVPRIATAYNYNRSDLAVYRFLCDLQHQNIKSDLTFNFQQLFPGLDHYPRVTYKGIVVSAAMWRVDPKDFLSGDKEKNISRLKARLSANKINTRFKCGNADQTLCIDPNNTRDIDAFLTYCKQNSEKEIYIQEALIDETTMIEDENGKEYLPQYIANYFHEQPVYRNLQSYTHLPEAEKTAYSAFLPGSEWLYFEIYCHPLRANDILEQRINAIIITHKKQLQKWFFIRYSDPKPHIRLRLQVKNKAFVNEIICHLKTGLESLWTDGLIADIQIKAYLRETERYGLHRMDKVEDWFHYDSKYVLKLLSQNYNDKQLYRLTLELMNRLFELAFENIDERISLIKTISDNFSNEFSISNDDYKVINKSFESFRADKSNYTLPASESFLKQYDNAFNSIMNTCNAHEKASMVADIIHMHVNRVFCNEQRMHEAILYQYLQKLVRMQKHLAVVEVAL